MDEYVLLLLTYPRLRTGLRKLYDVMSLNEGGLGSCNDEVDFCQDFDRISYGLRLSNYSTNFLATRAFFLGIILNTFA